MSSFRVVVPTRDNSRWLLPFLLAYRRLGVKPFYIVDARTEDRTLTLLKDHNADFVVYPGDPTNIVEGGILRFAARRMPEGCSWTLRLDDDEFPSQELISWLHSDEKESSTRWVVSRRDLLNAKLGYGYNRHWAMYHDVSNPDYHYGHIRIYKHDSVDFIETIHTAGIKLDECRYVPETAYFVHLDAILRSLSERIEKLRAYERDHPGSSWRFGNNYLPELCPPEHVNAALLGTDQFDELLKTIPQALQETRVELAVSELQTLRLGGFDKQSFQVQAEKNRALKQMETGLASRRLGEFLCTISSALSKRSMFPESCKALRCYGALLQHRARLSKR